MYLGSYLQELYEYRYYDVVVATHLWQILDTRGDVGAKRKLSAISMGNWFLNKMREFRLARETSPTKVQEDEPSTIFTKLTFRFCDYFFLPVSYLDARHCLPHEQHCKC